MGWGCVEWYSRREKVILLMIELIFSFDVFDDQ